MDGDVREFENTFSDFGSDTDFIEYNEETNEIHPKWKEKLENYINHQLKIINQMEFNDKDKRLDVSVYTGYSGICLLYIFISETLGENYSTYLKKAQTLNETCVKSFRGHRLSFMCGDTGALAIGAVICHKQGMHNERNKFLEKLIRLHNSVVDLSVDFEDEMLYGRAGYLYCLLYVRSYIKEDHYNLQSAIKLVIQAILESGKTLSRKKKWKCPLMYSWHDKYYMGAAHGITGILYMLLQVSEMLTEDEKRNLIKPTIDFLITLKFPSGNYPSSYGNHSDKLVHWCHGAPGFVHLFIIAYKVFDEEIYLQEALSCGDVIWKRGLLKKGYGICHGVAGNAFAFLQLYRLTNDRKHLYRATKFAQWCLDFEKRTVRTPDRPLSLFEGIAGTIWFITSMLNPATSKFPAFQLW